MRLNGICPTVAMTPKIMSKTLQLSPEEMKTLGYTVIDQIVAHYEQVPTKPVSRKRTRHEMEALFKEPVPTKGEEPQPLIERLSRDLFENIMHLDHPRFFPFVPGPSNYVGLLGDLLAHGHNVFAGTWLESSAGTQIEITTIDWLKEIVGYPNEAEGLFTSGGSMANLTAIVVAREQKLKRDRRGMIYCADQTHSSIERAIRILGGQLRLVKISTKENFQVDQEVLLQTIASDEKNGDQPLMVIGNAGTTNTGAVDDLEALRDISDRYGMWLHVDGAYGGPGILSSEKHLFKGMELADSVSLDPHKWLFQPYEIGCVMVRSPGLLLETFSLVPEYLKDTKLAHDEINFFNMGPQMTRSFRALKLWLSLKTFGIEAFREAIEHGIAMARYFESLIRQMDNWEVVTPAQLAIVNIRYSAPGTSESDSNQVNSLIVEEMMNGGMAMVGSTVLNGKTCIRLCIINPRTTKKDMDLTAEMLARVTNTL